MELRACYSLQYLDVCCQYELLRKACVRLARNEELRLYQEETGVLDYRQDLLWDNKRQVLYGRK